MAPQSVEIIECPCGFVKDMNDHIRKIHQNPMPSGNAFDGGRTNTDLICSLFYSLSDALNLAIRSAGTDDEIVRDRSVFSNLK